ncbi:CHAD domain-containing protein [Chitinophaga sp. 212800010-3]|uniref:CHAD domain-containing protein n=1 Tax=unclassified Chitinophaga TaxID=2619133 RepID=UPI002DF4F951|nr:CHAD domain-containing protein [Chitinophaga sp. 212800010-3]
MLQTALYHYLRKECDTVADAYDRLQQSPADADAVHVLRVGVKKLRAFFSLAQQLPGYAFGAGKHLHEVRLIQGISGASRDAYLQEKRLQQYEKKVDWRFSAAHLLLHSRRDTAKDMLEITLKHCSLKKLGNLPEKFRKAIEDIDPDAATTALSDYLQQQHQHIQLPASKAHHTVWHGVRKEVKSLYYQVSMLDQLLPAVYTDHLADHARKAGELLGQWHDTSELLLFVRNTATQVRKAKMSLPVNVKQMISLLQKDMKEELALCADQVRKLQNIFL